MSNNTDNLDDLESYSDEVDSIDRVITLIALFHVVTGLLTIPVVYSIFMSDLFQAPVIVTLLVIIHGSVLAVTIPVVFVLGWAIWSLQSWAWKVAIIVNVVFLIFNVIGGVILIAILNIVLLFALYGSDVRLALTHIDEQDYSDPV